MGSPASARALERLGSDGLWQLAGAVEASIDGVAVLSADGTYLYVNAAHARIYGYDSSDELVGRTWRVLYDAGEVRRFDEEIMPAFEREGRWRGEAVGKRRDGTGFDQEISLTRLSDGAFVCIARDISEQRRAERAIRESEERYRQIFEMNQAVKLLIDPADGSIVDANPAAAEFYGYPLDRLKAMKITALNVLPREALEREMSRAVTKRRIDFVFQHRLASGAIRSVEVHSGPVEVEGRTLLFSIVHDITERKRAEEGLRRSEEKYRKLFEQSRDAIYITSREGRLLDVNRSALELFGYTREEMVGMDARELYVEAADRARYQRAIERHGEVNDFEVRLRRKDGTRIDCLLTATVRRGYEGEVLGYHGVIHDITERKRAEDALRESEERYALAVRGASDGLWDWDLARGTIYFSPRWKTMLGLDEDVALTDPDAWFRRVHAADRERLESAIRDHLEGLTPHFEHEHRILHEGGEYRWMLTRGIAVRDESGRAYRMAGSQTDITDRKRAEEKLLHDAFHDALTGLANRALFMDRLGRLIERSKRRSDLFAVLFLDLDRFKVVNDSLGHLIGDQLLIAIARRLEECLRPADTVARLGGDEFVVLLDDIGDVSDATRIADRILKALELPFYPSGHEVYTAASMGIAVSATGYDRPEELLRDADIALYRAKELGRGRHEVFDTAMHTQAVSLLELETDMRHAIERQDFRLVYQPIIGLSDGRIIGFEALLRWQHPDRGLLSPEDFIPLAEETGLIGPIGEWVLREACRQMRAWQEAQPAAEGLILHVNLSGKQFAQRDLVERIATVLDETGLAPRCLKIEITESVVMGDAESSIAMFSQLKEMGIQLCIDDFGTGYSSLSYLHRFPTDTLKIDRSFIGRIGPDGENLELVRTIVALARNLGMDTIPEGVETAVHVAHLQAIGCDLAQGYYFAGPLGPEAAADYLTDALEGEPAEV